jgi:polar amino acid transport system substrate-binding protein
MSRQQLWLRLITLSLLLVTLVACEQVGLMPTRTPTPPFSASTPTNVPAPEGASTAARIRARGYLVVGVRYDDAPFGNIDEQGDLVGFDVDLAHEFAYRWLGDSNAVRFVQVTNASASERVRSGRVDLIVGALTHNQDDARDMDFSQAYYYDGLALLTRPGVALTSTVAINGPGDLHGVAVAVVQESGTETPLLRAAGGAEPVLVDYPDYFSAVGGLESGVVGAVVGPWRSLARLAEGSSDLYLTPRFTRAPYAIGMPKNEGDLRDLVNVTLTNLIVDHTYETFYQQWFPGEALPGLEIWAGTSYRTFDQLGDTPPPAATTIQDIEARGYLIVGLLDNQLPFGDFDTSGVARGFEAELVRTLAGLWLGNVGAVQFVSHSDASGSAALQAGQIDLLAAHMPHALRREDEIDLSLSIYQGGIGLLVGAESGVSNLTDLNGGAVAVLGGGIAADVVQRAAAEAGIMLSIQTVSDAGAALAGLNEGRYRAFGDWRIELLRLAYTNGGLVVLDERLTSRPIALGLRQNDTAFRDLLDLSLQKLGAEGRFAALYDDWFGTDPPYAMETWPGNPYRALKLNALPVAVP